MDNPLSKESQEKKISELEQELAKLKGQVNSEQDRFIEDELRKPLPEFKTLFKWSSPSRPFVRRDKKYFLKVAAGILVGILVAAVLQNIPMILVLSALMFVIYVFGTVEPEKVNHAITTRGINTMNETYLWAELRAFWFSKKHGSLILNVETRKRYPSRIIMLVSEDDLKQIMPIVYRYLEYTDIPKQGWLSRRSDGAFLRFSDDETGVWLKELLSTNDQKLGKVPYSVKLNLRP